MNKARVTCFIAAILAAIELKSILLANIASKIEGKTSEYFKIQRLQRFFRELMLDFKQIALLVMQLASIDPKTPMILAIDRTDWEKRKNDINMLVLSVCMGDTGIPILWKNLGCEGNSNTNERINLIWRFISFFGAQQIV